MSRIRAGRAPLAVALGLTLCLGCAAVQTGTSTGSPARSPTPAQAISTASTSLTPTVGPTGSPVVTPIPPGPDIEAGAMLDLSDGWAVTGDRLWITADAGRTWRDATPPGGLGTGGFQRFLGATFVDPQHGWVAVNATFASPTDAGYGRVDVWHTADGGRTWLRTRLPPAVLHHFGEVMPRVQLDFLDPAHGFAFLSGNPAQGRQDSDLYWTADGGRTWSADRPTGGGGGGIEGTVGFATADDGVVVGIDSSPGGVAVTRDGGRTWSAASIALTAATSTDLSFDALVFFDARSGLISVDRSWVERTADGGGSWTLAATLPAGMVAVSFLGPTDWVGLAGSTVRRTTDGGRTWTSEAQTLPLPGAVGSFRMLDQRAGWASVFFGVCLGFKTDCSSRVGLYATVDGGATWGQLWPR